MTLGGECFKEWNKGVEDKQDTFGIVDCIKRVEVGETVHSSQKYVDTQHGKKFAGVVTNVSSNAGKTNILTLQGNGVDHINEYWTQEYQNNILASEEAIRRIKNNQKPGRKHCKTRLRF